MDGWSNYELKLLSEEDVDILAALYNSVLQTGVWPDQLCHGLVTLLAKIDNPETPKHGRPVTILPVLYRLFAKIMSKKVFTHWQGHLPESLFGSVPGRSSIDAAWQLASQIEQAMSEGKEFFGVSLDLSKAYNTLHRNILSALALRAGWPPQLVRAYVNYLNNVQRYFRIGDGCYGPQSSKVGVPEGCPLAVPAMILFTWAITNHARSQGHCLTSYVDNWAVQTHCRRSVTDFLQLVHRATSSFKLILNPDKTRAYSTTVEGRSYLRSLSFQGFPLAVTLKVSDLGVDFNSGKQATCSLLNERITAAEPKLRRLRAMPWSHTRKAQVLLKVVHPAVSFGCEFASTAPSTCSNLRGKYSSAIWGLANTRNHFLSPLLGLGVQYDPFILFLTTRLSTLRRQFCHNAVALYSNWNAVMHAAPVFGPLTYLFAQLQILGWRILPQCTCVTSAGLHVNLCLTSKKTLRELVLNSWWAVVAPKLPSQPGYELASNVNVTHTMCLRRVTQASVPIIGSFSVGAALSSKQKRHFLDEDAAKCRYCGAEDSYTHRLRGCPHFASLRSTSLIDPQSSFSDTQLLRGLFEIPPEVATWFHVCESLPWPDITECLQEHALLFTDGSTMPHSVVPRSSWSVVLAFPRSHNFEVLFADVLPGKQCNYRAELFAVLVTVQCAVTADVFSDNLGVVQGFSLLLKHGWVADRFLQLAETELWWAIWSLIRHKRLGWTITHVHSHTNPWEQTTDFLQWCAFHNDKADHAAKCAQQKWTNEQATIFRTAVSAANAQLLKAHRVFKFQEDVVKNTQTGVEPALANIANAQMSEVESARTYSQSSAKLIVAVPGQSMPSPVEFQDGLLSPRFLWVLQAFLRDQVWVQSDEAMSVLEVYVLFVKQTGWLSPQNLVALPPGVRPPSLAKCNCASLFLTEVDYPSLSVCRQPLGKQTTTFYHAMKFVAKRHGIDFQFSRSKSLAVYGCHEMVPSLSLVPRCLRPAGQSPVHSLLGAWKYSSAMRTVFGPDKEPMECPIAYMSPQEVWNNYCKGGRSRRRANAG